MSSPFGTVLRRLRAQAGMTQEQLAEQSQIAVRTIRRLETDPSAEPRVKTVTLLANALDTSPDSRRELLAAINAAPPLDPEPAATPPPPPAPLPRTASQEALLEAADQLRQVLQARWQREEEQRRIHDPFPLPVRFRSVPARLADVDSGPSGTLGDIAATYRRLTSGRLVVLGSAGSGKTILTTRFALDFLATREPDDPVPVVFSLGSWDPTSAVLRDWLIERLLRDHPGLVATAPNGSTLAKALVEAGLILPVLDGFDEIAGGLHRVALDGLNATTLPLVLTSRREEYEKAARATTLARAACVELTPLAPSDVDEYLPRTTPGDHGGAWAEVLDALRDRPGDLAATNLAQVLRTPLMVGLARTAYSDAPGQDPAELLDTARFPTPEAIEDHLLDRFLPTVYRPLPAANPLLDWDPELARRWLGHLARHLDRLGTTDIAWWRLGLSLSRSTRILAVALGGSIATGLILFLSYAVLYLVSGQGLGSLRVALSDGLLVGPEVGLAFGLAYGVMVVFRGAEFEPARMRVRLPGRRRRGTGRSVRELGVRFRAGTLTGLAVALGYAPGYTATQIVHNGFPVTLDEIVRTTLINGFLYCLMFGLTTGPLFVLAYALEAPVDISSATSPTTMLATNRSTVLRSILLLTPVLVLAVILGGQLLVTVFDGVLGPLRWLPDGIVVGVLAGLTGAACYALTFTAWGQWLLLTRLVLPLTGRLPWPVTTFLDDAYQRGVLRQAGAVYQFRHTRLQQHLAHATNRR
ncbi:NACHT domain-containing protein [Saccharopolyspora flava]|uniref:NACHT domain-containing protein n=1 Tax=Saccharopolyspora flava TaxID=95161 RepID=A0A1I6RNF6_9PSEU|nr:helix-turn-helix domain-containing protein [Saccharopolyspora flava]SFS66271.1 NACHT domain-containing protein [Saccharopolyspora flava]